MKTQKISGHKVNFQTCGALIVGAGAAGMNCAVHLHEFMTQKGVENAGERIAVITRGLSLGASRMSGSDKQTYYKLGTSPETLDSAADFARSLTAAGCCHEDLALIEGVGSLPEFYHLVRAGVPFPHDPLGSYVGYKTDNDPYERATSAGPKTSRFMSECLQREAEAAGVRIYDGQEVAALLSVGEGDSRRLIGAACVDAGALAAGRLEINVFLCENLVLAAGGPGELYATSVYPPGQVGLHGLALEAGLAAENLTESQFGLASIKFRWNVSGTYMQAIPWIFSTDAAGGDRRDFLADVFPTMEAMATAIFLKGYQWPFDPQRIEGCRSSLIDVLVFNETQAGRRVFLDFTSNPVGSADMKDFSLDALGAEARAYLEKAGAVQARPIERLAHMNTPAIEVFRENGIDLRTEPLEIALCAQHNNGGLAVSKWWESSIPRTFVIGEMAGTHGVKRPGGSALNAGQVGGLRAAQYIVNACGCEAPDFSAQAGPIERQVAGLIEKLDGWRGAEKGLRPGEVIAAVQQRMTSAGGHVREISVAEGALAEAVELYRSVEREGLAVKEPSEIAPAVQAEHLALAGVAYLKAVVHLLKAGGGSRGSYIVVADDGREIHPKVINRATGRPLRFKPENEELRGSIVCVEYDPAEEDLFVCRDVPVRKVAAARKAFETAWAEFREGKVFRS